MTTPHTPPTPVPADLDVWGREVAKHFPHLSKSQAWVLALWSFGMVISQACGLTTVTYSLATLLGRKVQTTRQQLREWYEEADAKKRNRALPDRKRRALEVTACFVPLLQWVLETWPTTEKRLALAIDATTLGLQFTALVLSVIYRGCAIPIAWKILPACSKGAWKPHWLAMFNQLTNSLPADWCVLVLADRGLYAPWLYQAIVRLGWHPYLRINTGGKYHLWGTGDFLPLTDLARPVGMVWCERVTCFKRQSLACTLLVYRDDQHDDAWLILTDLAPHQAQVAWYSMRAWQEAGFKDTKRGGWQWQHTRMTDPDRAARLWLAIAVATLWVVRVGGEADANVPVSSLDALPPTHVARRHAKSYTRLRLVSCFKLGVCIIITALIAGHPLPLGTFHPDPWPDVLRSKKTYP